MEITKLTPQKKSVLLAKAMGWTVETFSTGNYEWRGEQYRAYWTGPNGEELSADIVGYSEQEAAEVQMVNFYDGANAALAGRILNWAYDTGKSGKPEGHYAMFRSFIAWWDGSQFTAQIPARPFSESQTIWLDKILSLAIEAGLVQP